ncbi:MAG: CDP-diacylglycerol--serine O-phosphatidyltransferase [Planctomycetota bacterium]|nr:CDP-diacylglycerol--serine O-phosphatidyltransferase [Planctomycetota bacterium]
MPKKKTETAKKALLRRVRRQRLKYISILPSLITIVNGVCGFTAIILASKGSEQALLEVPVDSQKSYFAMSGYLILLAMIADMLDGRLARKVEGTSGFGGQLDSLCDAISFGVAPVFLMLKIVECKLELTSFAGDSSVQRFIWLAAAAYLSCAVIRLARFNVENEEDESAHMSFMGLPTPAAAGVIVSLVIFHQEYEEALLMVNAVIYVLPFLALGVGVLMVSRLRYPHVLNQYLKGRKPFGHFIRVLLLLALLFFFPQIAFVLIFCGFALSSFVRWLYFRVPVSKFLARWSHGAIRNEDSPVPPGRQSVLTTGGKVQIDGHKDSSHRHEPK